MNHLVPFRLAETSPLALIDAAGDRARVRFIEFFTANIRNPHTRRLCAQRGGIPGLVRARWRAVDRHGAARPRRHLHRAAQPARGRSAVGTYDQAAARRDLVLEGSAYASIGLNVVRSNCYELLEQLSLGSLHDHSAEPPNDAFERALSN
jgi:hypothetical protein